MWKINVSALLPTFPDKNFPHGRLPEGKAGTYSTTCCGMETKLRTTPLIIGLLALLFAGAAAAQHIDTDLALAERALGDPNAPVEIVAYESLTCPHCAGFHRDTYDALKERYIDTGKVRFVFRDFPLDGTALRASMLARCANPNQFFGMIKVLFRSQSDWGRSHDAVGALGQIGRLAGINPETFDSCMANEDLLDGIVRMRQEGTDAGVSSTPTFFINGTNYPGNRSIDDFAAIIDPLLATN